MSEETKMKLIAVDGSEHSDHAIEWFFSNIYREGDEIGIIHVHVLPDLPSFGFAGHPSYEKILETNYFQGDSPVVGEYNARVQDSIAEAKKTIDKHKEAVIAKGMLEPKVFVETMHDSIGHTICKVAREHHASLIVIGQRGLGAIRRTLFGSVSDYVLHHAHTPVIVVSPKHQ